MGWWTDFLDLFRPRPKPKPGPKPVPPYGTASDLLIAHNVERGKEHTSALVLNVLLGVVAQKQAEWMNATKHATHTGERGSEPVQRMQDIGYYPMAAGENIAAGYTSVQQVMQAWMGSKEGHKENILNPAYVDVGFGVSGDYWCAVFGARTVHAVLPTAPVLSFPSPLRKGVV
jgi:uncharacterized protein YkwD